MSSLQNFDAFLQSRQQQGTPPKRPTHQNDPASLDWSREAINEELRRFRPPPEPTNLEKLGQRFGQPLMDSLEGPMESGSVAMDLAKRTVGKGFMDAMVPTDPVGKLPFGKENVGGPMAQAVKDVAYGIPEGVTALGAGLLAFPAGQVAGLKHLQGPQGQFDFYGAAQDGMPPTMAKQLADAFDTAEKITHAGMGIPQTATGQLLLKPIEAVFGTVLNTVGNVVTEMNPDENPETLEHKIKAAQYIANTVMLGLPLLALRGRGKGKAVKVPEEVVPEVLSPDTHITSKKVEQAKEIVKADPDVPAEVRAQVEALPADPIQQIAQLAERAKARAQVEGKLAEGGFKAAFNGNQPLVEHILLEAEMLSGRKKANMTKAAKIVAEMDGDVGAVNLAEVKGINPKGPTGKVIEEFLGPKREEAVVPKVEEAPAPKADPEPPVRVEPEVKAPEPVPEPVPETPPPAKALPEPVPEVRAPEPAPVPSEPLPISTFDTVRIAAEEGYKFPVKKRYGSLEEAQAKAATIEGAEVVQVGNKYRVAKFEETPVREFANEAAVEAAGLELMSEIPAERVPFESPSEGFGLAKVDGKYYRTAEKVDMPERLVVEDTTTRVKERWEDDVSSQEWADLWAMADEATRAEILAQERIKSMLKPEEAPVEGQPPVPRASSAELAQAFLEWRDSYVTKCNIARTKKKDAKPVTKESMALVDDAFKTFDTEQAARDWMESTGRTGELIQDPLTKKYSILDTEKWGKLDEGDIWTDGVEQFNRRSEHLDSAYEGSLDTPLSDKGTMDLWSIMNNERGSVDITSLRKAADTIESLLKEAEKAGKSLDDFLMSIGADEAAIAAFNAAVAELPHMRQQIREKDPIGEQILRPQGKIVAQKINKNRKGEIKSVGPPITEALATKAMTVDQKLQWGKSTLQVDPRTGRVKLVQDMNLLDRFMRGTETKINFFRSAKLMEDLYYPWRDAKAAAKREIAQTGEWVDTLRARIPEAERTNFLIAAYRNVKGGPEALKAMGLDPNIQVPKHHLEVLADIHKWTQEIFDRGNYVRTHTNQAPIKQLLDLDGNPNYIPLMRSMNVLREMGLTEGITTASNAKLGNLSKNFNGIFNPYKKNRKVSDIPIELDVFKTLERFAEFNLNEIHVSPVAALAKDLAYARLPHPKGKTTKKGDPVKVPLDEWNPYLSQRLSKWADDIVGKDPVASALSGAEAFAYRTLQTLSRNLVVATLGGSLRTVLVQPTAFMVNTMTMLNERSAVVGIGKMVGSRFMGKDRAREQSSVLIIRNMEYALKEYSDYLKQHGKGEGLRAYVANKAMAPMQFLDGLTAEATWYAAEHYGKRHLGLKDKDLIRYADDIVERTQGMGIKGAISDIQSNISTKWLTLLQTFGIADYNLLVREVMGVKNPELTPTKTLNRALRYMGYTLLVGELYKMIGLENVVPDPIGTFKKAQEEGKSDPAALFSASLDLLEKVPMLGGSVKYDSSLGGIAGEWGNIVPQAVKTLGELADWDNLTPRERQRYLRLMGRAMGMTLGIPFTNQIAKSINSHYQGGNPWEVILGVYDYEAQKRGGGSIRPNIPRPSIPRP